MKNALKPKIKDKVVLRDERYVKKIFKGCSALDIKIETQVSMYLQM